MLIILSVQCPCGELGTCITAGSPCNCDGSHTDTARDEGRITNREQLPIVGFVLGGTNKKKKAYFYATPLKCGPKQFGQLNVGCHVSFVPVRPSS